MDRYARQAGENGYDSDGEADDEFERSVFSPPTIPTIPTTTIYDDHDDDDGSDHPSESEDEHDSVDGEDTPTTQGWADRDARSPTGSLLQWTEDQVADYISALSPPLKQYSHAFASEGVTGEALAALHHDELRELGIGSVGHRLTILKAVYEQKLRNGVKVSEGDYIPLSAEGDKSDATATQDDIARVIKSIELRDQRILAAEAELRALRHQLDRIAEDNRKLREETLPMMRLVKDQRSPLPDPQGGGGTLPSPRDPSDPKSQQTDTLAPAVKETKVSSLSRKFSTKKLFLGNAPKQPSPTHPPPASTPQQQPREVRDDTGTHLEASAAAMAASNHLTASMTTSQASPAGSSQLSPTSPAYSTQQVPSSGGSYHQQPGSAGRRGYAAYNSAEEGTGYSASSHWSQASTIVAAERPPQSARQMERQRRLAPTPSPRELGEEGWRERERGERYVGAFVVVVDDDGLWGQGEETCVLMRV